ncbi:hypothetical protein BGZ65_009704, partial [Modicella reniformis]
QQQEHQQLLSQQEVHDGHPSRDSFDLSGSENEHWDGYGNVNENENDTDDLDENHYRRDSDESHDDGDDNDAGHGRGGRRYHLPAPRRFRRFGTLPPIQNDSDDEEAEEYLYDSDEPVTIRFTDHGR